MEYEKKCSKFSVSFYLVSSFPIAHLLNRMYQKSRRGHFLFLSGATFLSIFMLPKQGSVQQKQKVSEETSYQYTRKQPFSLISMRTRICRDLQTPQKSMTLLLPPSVCVQGNGFQILLPFDKGNIPATSFPCLSDCYSFTDYHVILYYFWSWFSLESEHSSSSL